MKVSHPRLRAHHLGLKGTAGLPRFHRVAADFRNDLSPLTGAGAEALLKTGVKKSQVVEPAFLRYVDYFGIGIDQQRNGLQKAHLHPQGRDRKPKVLVKKPVQVTTTATEFFRELSHR
jgi:hypothetical protein